MNDIERSLKEQIGLSIDGPASPAFSLRGQTENQPELLPSTWGLAWYPDNQRAAAVLKDRDLPQGTPLSGFLEQSGNIYSSVFVGHTHGLQSNRKKADTQPFMKSYAGRQWLFTSAGDLTKDIRSQLPIHEDFFDLVPVGPTADEHALSWIISQIRSRGCKTIDEFGWIETQNLLERINEFGTASIILTDGIDLVAYRDKQDVVPLYWTRRVPPHASTVLEGRTFVVSHDGPMDVSRTVFVFATLPMRGAAWTPMVPGELRVARRGISVWSSHPAGIEEQNFQRLGAPHPIAMRQSVSIQEASAQQQQQSTAPEPQPEASSETALEPDEAILSVVHRTHFRYSAPVERSSHRFCLEPVRDERQHVLEHELTVSVDGISRSYEDVFGNRARQLEVTHPFTEMEIISRSKLRVTGVLGSQLKSPLRRDQIPLVWMPWQRQMMQAYLMPPELPEPELRELSEFAMSFVERNDYDLVETLLDMNRTIYRDFTYVTGSTHIETTPFQVYSTRKGVCQDFANILICLARLLSVPARYRVGYIYTGGGYENKIQSDASHAWAEVYLPWTGWFGFDPTNGCLAAADHVRIACGRQFRDAAPTTGTIYRGGGSERLEVGVRVERLDDEGIRV